MKNADHKYHSGKFCPITKEKCRLDCVSLVDLDYCTLIDGAFTLSRRIEELIDYRLIEMESDIEDLGGRIARGVYA